VATEKKEGRKALRPYILPEKLEADGKAVAELPPADVLTTLHVRR
jgi:hypothetical protein